MDSSIFGVQSTTLAITAALTGVLLVVGALVIAWLIGPRSYTKKKGEPFECGIPTRGDSMAQYHVGYYLFAILFQAVLGYSLAFVFYNLGSWYIGDVPFGPMQGVALSLVAAALYFILRPARPYVKPAEKAHA